jgi:hypothetical protein
MKTSEVHKKTSEVHMKTSVVYEKTSVVHMKSSVVYKKTSVVQWLAINMLLGGELHRRNVAQTSTVWARLLFSLYIVHRH